MAYYAFKPKNDPLLDSVCQYPMTPAEFKLLWPKLAFIHFHQLIELNSLLPDRDPLTMGWPAAAGKPFNLKGLFLPALAEPYPYGFKCYWSHGSMQTTFRKHVDSCTARYQASLFPSAALEPSESTYSMSSVTQQPLASREPSFTARYEAESLFAPIRPASTQQTSSSSAVIQQTPAYRQPSFTPSPAATQRYFPSQGQAYVAQPPSSIQRPSAYHQPTFTPSSAQFHHAQAFSQEHDASQASTSTVCIVIYASSSRLTSL